MIESLQKDNLVKPESKQYESELIKILNNITVKNSKQYAEKLSVLLNKDDKYSPWTVNYIIIKRITSQSQRLQDYARTFTMTRNSKFIHRIIQECIEIFLRILSQKKLVSTQNDEVVKNVSSFLGHMTLRQNKPLLEKYIDLKQLIVEGFLRKDVLSMIIIIVCKIIKDCQLQTVFSFKNPFVLGLTRMLHEILSDFRDMLDSRPQKEIEILFKELKTDGKNKLLREIINPETENFEAINILQRIKEAPYINDFIMEEPTEKEYFEEQKR